MNEQRHVSLLYGVIPGTEKVKDIKYSAFSAQLISVLTFFAILKRQENTLNIFAAAGAAAII